MSMETNLPWSLMGFHLDTRWKSKDWKVTGLMSIVATRIRTRRRSFLLSLLAKGFMSASCIPKQLKRFPGIFTFSDDRKIIHLSRTLSNEKDCSAAVGGVMQILCQEGFIHSWRNEHAEVSSCIKLRLTFNVLVGTSVRALLGDKSLSHAFERLHYR